MPLQDTKACQRKTLSVCAITALLFLMGLLMIVVIFVTLRWQYTAEEHSNQDPTHDPYDNISDGCSSKAAVFTDEEITQKRGFTKNFTQAWCDAKQKARAPAHTYMEKHHSIAIYMYTSVLLQLNTQKSKCVHRTGEQQKETFESNSVYSTLSEAIQVLRHSQVTCLSTTYRSETLLNSNYSGKLLRFSTFVLGSDWWNSSRNASCFEVYTCFGANITHYSALEQNIQVLIPPYEVFKVTDIETDAETCKVLYKLKSNLNCVYDKESNTLHPISAFHMGVFWPITIIGLIVVSLLLSLVVVKVIERNKNRAVHSASSLFNSTYSPVCVGL